jgi:TolB protein
MYGPTTGLAFSFVLAVAGQASGPGQDGLVPGGRPIIDVSGAAFQTLPLAIPDVKVMKAGAPVQPGSPLAVDPAADAAADLTRLLREDLNISGIFRVLDPAGYLPNAQKEGLVLGSFNLADWMNIGATGLLKVGLSREGDQSKVEARLFDVAMGREVLSMKYQGPSSAERRMGHRVADDVYRHYTKEPGIFRTKIATIRAHKGRKDVHILDVDGRNGRSLNLPDGLNLLPGWEPSGAGILFTSYAAGSPDLYRADLQSGAITRLSGRPGLNSGAAVSPDGQFIAVTLSMDGNSEIYLLSKGGEIVRRLTRDPQIDSSPSWSPDGKKIAFVSARGGTPQIYVMDVEGGDKTAKRLTFQGSYNQTPDWSPRGDKIAFTARDERAIFDVFVVDVATNKIDRLTQDTGNNEEPTWAPNGRLLAFTSDRTGSSQLFIMTPDGNVQRQVTRETAAAYSTPAWGPLPPDND